MTSGGGGVTLAILIDGIQGAPEWATLVEPLVPNLAVREDAQRPTSRRGSQWWLR
jgi:hypothetical protein